MASEKSKSIPDVVVICCIVLLLAIVGGAYYASSINERTGPQVLSPGFLQHHKMRAGMQSGSNPASPMPSSP